MKKLIVAVCAMALAGIAEASAVEWQSGALWKAENSTGGWNASALVIDEPAVVVTMNLFLVDADTYNTVAIKDQKGMYEWASSQTADYTAVNKSDDKIVAAATIYVNDTLAANTTYYSILTAEYTDATYGNMYMATAVSLVTGETGDGKATNLFGGGTGVRNWQGLSSIPEPTSGLLLLLGMAGLALKRKRV